jgi:hypothetical protein
MFKKTVRWFGVAALGGMLLQGGCSLQGLTRNIWVGFGQSIGSVPAGILVDAYVTPLLNDLINPDDDGDGTQ